MKTVKQSNKDKTPRKQEETSMFNDTLNCYKTSLYETKKRPRP